jgi:hypothetical protein
MCEDFTIEALVTHPAVKTLDIGILPRGAGGDVDGADFLLV